MNNERIAMKRLTLATLVAAACAHGPASAQEYAPFALEVHELMAPADDARMQADAWKRWAEDFSREMRTSMGALYSNRVMSHRLVKGAPYSARIVTELNRPLADGNVISHKHEAAVYRDGEGRTRQETIVEGGKRTSIVIDDPVDQKHYLLVPERKRAIETTVRMRGAKIKDKALVKVDGKTIRIENGKVFVDGKEATDTVVMKSRSGKEVRVENGKVTIDGKDVEDIAGNAMRHVEVRTVEAPEGTREEVRVQVVRPGDSFELPPGVAPPAPPVPPAPPRSGVAPPPPPVPPVPPIPGVQTMRFEGVGKLGKGTTASLGTKEIEGVKAEGKQTTWTIPAGEVGNRNPINITSESWYSPDLQVTVYSRYNDPRTGESIYRLAGIKRGEPGTDLFKVPPDYEVRGRNR
jgi:hypothetical protein